MLRKIRLLVLFAAIVLSLYFPTAVTYAAFNENIPSAVDDFYKVAPGETLSVPAPGILSNDISRNGQPLTAIVTNLYLSDPSKGTLAVNADGSFTYTANPNTRGFITFRYRANNGMYDSDDFGDVVIDITYQVTFYANGGNYIKDTRVYHNDTLNLPPIFTPTREGYTFAGWYTDVMLTVPYDFSHPVTSNFSLHAKWTYNAGGSGSLGGAGGTYNPVIPPTTSPSTAGMPETPVSINATFGANNAISTVLPATYNPTTLTIATNLDSAAAQNLIDKALWAKAVGQNAIASIQFGSVANASAVTVILPREGFKKMVVEKLTFQLNSDIGAIMFGSTELSSIDRSLSSGNITLGIKKLSKESLNSSTQAKVKNSPVYRFELSVGNTPLGKISGSAKISVPYTLKPGEKAKAITVYYIDNKGALRSVKASYNSKTKMASFSLSRF